MVEPTYFMACPMFEDAGFVGRLRGVPEDDEGVDIEFLKAALAKADSAEDRTQSDDLPLFKTGPRYPKLYRHVIYVVPSYSNPSGKVMSLRRRQELVQVARKHDALIIADDVYDMLRWSTDIYTDPSELPPPPPRIVDVDRDLKGGTEFGNACSNGSFSKIIAPGVRVSWVEGTERFAQHLSTHGFTKSGGCPSQMTSLAIYHMLESGVMNAHLKTKIIPTYQSRYNVMRQAIKTHLEPLGVYISGGQPVYWTSADGSQATTAQAGGFFMFIMFPDDLPPAAKITDIALKSYALKIPGGNRMVAVGDPDSVRRSETTFGRGVRLSWSWLEEGDIQEGIERLATVIQDIRSGTVKAELPIELLRSLMHN